MHQKSGPYHIERILKYQQRGLVFTNFHVNVHLIGDVRLCEHNLTTGAVQRLGLIINFKDLCQVFRSKGWFSEYESESQTIETETIVYQKNPNNHTLCKLTAFSNNHLYLSGLLLVTDTSAGDDIQFKELFTDSFNTWFQLMFLQVSRPVPVTQS